MELDEIRKVRDHLRQCGSAFRKPFEPGAYDTLFGKPLMEVFKDGAAAIDAALARKDYRERSPKFPCLGLVRQKKEYHKAELHAWVIARHGSGFELLWESPTQITRWDPGSMAKNLELITDNPDYPPDPKLVELFKPAEPQWEWPEVLKGFWGMCWDENVDFPSVSVRPASAKRSWWESASAFWELRPEVVKALGITLPPKPDDWRTPVLNPNWKEPVE